MRLRAAVAVTAATAAFALAGCGDDGPLDRDAVKEAGCQQPTNVGTDEMYAVDAWTCGSGEVARVITFADNDARDDFVKVATHFGNTYTKGDRWAAEARRP